MESGYIYRMENKNLQADTAASSRPEQEGTFCTSVFPGFFCACGKTPEQIRRQVYQLLEEHEAVLATCVEAPAGNLLVTAFPEGEYDPAARVFLIRPLECHDENVFILASEREDLPGALEAKYTLTACGIDSKILRLPDPGDPEHLTELKKQLRNASVCIAVAGTLTALPEIAVSLTDAPVIALPLTVLRSAPLSGLFSISGALTSSFKGLVAAGCDNAAGAGFAAARILRAARKR